ncbi:hypothetical protein KB1_08470 [Cutibacterium modestum]|uniref:Uncharacterized protein n=1 Tax=Cutibacterium modestum TaxID=2559073 RepID=A0AAD1KP72_9ACTN|nr:hypothetical protein HMPREF9621_01308 [Cutibacterium modestum HL037PA2]BCY24857.1 hypothetical protein KB1_08470 [Cutibacterium modestum]
MPTPTALSTALDLIHVDAQAPLSGRFCQATTSRLNLATTTPRNQPTPSPPRSKHLTKPSNPTSKSTMYKPQTPPCPLTNHDNPAHNQLDTPR